MHICIKYIVYIVSVCIDLLKFLFSTACTIDCEQRSNFYVAVLLVFQVATGLNA